MWPLPTERLLQVETEPPEFDAHRQRVDTRLSEIKGEIQAREGEVCALRNFRNRMLPVNLLPPEILSTILVSFVSETRRSTDNSRTALGMMEPWLTVTRICRHWRDVAMKCGRLWSNLSFSSLTFTQLMLERSLQAPLSISIYLKENHKFLDILTTALSQSRRLRSIDIVLDEHIPLETVWPTCTSETPNLKLLRLKYYPTEQGDSKLPEPFLQHEAPPLEYLSLDGFHIPDWRSIPLSPSLTFLCIRAKNGKLTTGASPEKIMSSLAAMPLLNYLEISGLLPSDPYPPLPTLTLKHLKTLRLSAPMPAINAFLQVVHLPKLMDLQITFKDQSRDLSSFLRALSSSWDLARNEVQSLRLKYSEQWEEGYGHRRSCFDTLSLAFSRPEGSKPIVTDMVLHFPGRNLSVEPILRSIGRAGLTPLHTLEFDSVGPVHASVWTELFSDLPYLRFITIKQALPRGFVTALKCPAGARTIPFSALENLVLDGVNFRYTTPGISMGPILDLLEAMASRPKQIKKLRMYRCLHFERSDMELFQTRLPDLQVAWSPPRG
ncbi:hypothetical protein D9611_001244 [Ephemerocybe angulata]|uniref:F-box domain-containing protein n=1 Tax=Ephemerocybe angulata TaxID=980116 RepID=A0A8H5CJ03_9AGAR|nr:hypothetical protein D9611_001244 [Tulosesus angulatus]